MDKLKLSNKTVTVKIQPAAIKHLLNMVAEFEARISEDWLQAQSPEFLEDYVSAVSFLIGAGVKIESPRRVLEYLNRLK